MGKHFTFSGLATRKQFWLNQLAVMVAIFVAGLIAAVGIAANSEAGIIMASIIAFAILVAAGISAWSYLARRVRDTGNSAWLAMLVVIPYIGIVPFLYFGLTKKSITHGTVEAE